MWLHHRSDDHLGLEDCTTVELTEQIGRYPAGSVLCAVLADMVLRMTQVEIDTRHGFSVFGLDAWIAPYAGTGATGYFGLDATIAVTGTGSFGLDAVLEAPTPVERTGDFGLDAYFIPRGADGITVITAPIDEDDTVIHVDDPDELPGVCPYQIQIGDEVMTVVGGCGTDTLTVERDDPQAHPVGAYVATC